MMVDILVRNGRIADGTGAPLLAADVAIEGERIAAVGEMAGATAATVIDAAQCIVAPGFIDMHSHADLTLSASPTADNFVQQGITTAVVGQCGFSPAPALTPECRRLIMTLLAADDLTLPWEEWGSFAAYLNHLSRVGMSLNVVPLVGHGMIRAGVMGFGAKRPSPGQLARMKKEVEKAAEDGAFGLSSGLIYPPGSYGATEELVSLTRPVAARGGFYFSHIRGEGETLLNAVAEAVSIGRQTGAPVEVCHFKAAGRANWGKAALALEIIDKARADGLEVRADMYPYLAVNTSLVSMLPEWAQDGGHNATMKRLNDADTRRAMVAAMESSAAFHEAGWNRVLISSAPRSTGWAGRYVADLAAESGKSGHEWVFDALLEADLAISMIAFLMSEDNLKEQLQRPWMMIGTDAFAISPGSALSRGAPHPRSYGTFPRVLGRYVREQEVLSWEEAIRRMSYLPAQALRLADRGAIRVGYKADLVIFNPAVVADQATYEKPHQYPIGIRAVVVNGAPVVRDGAHTGQRPGEVLVRP